MWKTGQHLSEEHKKRISQSVIGKNIGQKNGMYGKNADKHPMWKGGRRITYTGYILIYKPDHPYCVNKRYVFEHRLVMEEYLGRYLTKNEDVHHINGDKQDNRIENLQLMTKSEHTKLFGFRRTSRTK